MHGPPDRDGMALTVASAYAAMYDGQLPEAGDLVANLLRQIDRGTAPPAKVLIELAVLWAFTLVDGDAPAEAVAWTQWAVAAAEERYGPADRVTCRARLALAGLLDQYGDQLNAAEQYARLAARADTQGKPHAAYAWEMHAVALHRGGRCQDGIDVLTGLAKQDPGRLVRPRTEYLHQVAVMLAACGRNREALACLADANVHTPAGDWPPLVLGVVTGPIADADPMHWAVCERQRPRQAEPGLHPPRLRADWRRLLP